VRGLQSSSAAGHIASKPTPRRPQSARKAEISTITLFCVAVDVRAGRCRSCPRPAEAPYIAIELDLLRLSQVKKSGRKVVFGDAG
jgi:hypothetical protein